MQSRSLKTKVPIGTQVTIINKKFPNKKAKVLFIGEIPDEAAGEWIGVQLLGGQKGNHSGSLKGKNYFNTSVPNTGIFVRPKDATLNGKVLSELVESSESPLKKPPPTTKTEPAETSKFAKKDTKTGDKPVVTTGKTTAVTIKKQKEQEPPKPTYPPKKQKLQTQLQNLQQTQKYQQRIQQLQKQNRQLKQAPINKIKQQNQGLMARIKEVQQQLHNTKMSIQRKANQVQPERELKLTELNSEILFYKKMKQDGDKEKKKLEGKVVQLEAALEEAADNEEFIQKLNTKIEYLEGKNESMRSQLETTKTQLKNFQSTGGGGGGEKSESVLNEEISILNETVTVLESEAKENQDKIELLEKEIKASSAKISQFTTLEKKLKQREKQVAELKESIQQHDDTISFVQQLSLTKLRLQQQLKATKQKINDLLNEKDLMEQNQLDQQQIARQYEHEITVRDIEIQNYIQKVKDKQSQIGNKVRQIDQYKDRITQLLRLAEQNNNLAQLKAARQAMEGDIEGGNTQMVPVKNNHLLDIVKFSEAINQKFIKLQNDNVLVRNKAGVFLLNLFQALPEQFIQQFYPEAIESLIMVKTAKDKAFYLFQWICTELREKNELYTDQNTDLTSWMLLLQTRLQRSYYNLLRIDLLISNCQTQQQLGNIITHRGIRDQSIVLDAQISDLLIKFSENNISSSYTFQRVDHANGQLESECAGFNKVMSKDNETKMELCRTVMDSLNSAYSMILSYRILSDLRENAQIDVGFDTFLKRLKQYLGEICLGNHFRYKPKMKNLIDDISLFKDTFKEIEADDKALLSLQNLGSPENQTLKLLKQSILSSQSCLKQLIADLDQIQLKDQLHKIQGKLQGSVWGKKLISMKEQLLKVRQIAQQKAVLQFQLIEHKKKIIIQEKEIKDKVTVKDVLEKRIGELQLKAEEVAVLKNEIERMEYQLKNVTESNKVMEQEIDNLIKRKQIVEQQNKKMKQSYEQTAPSRQQRTSLKQMNHNLSYAFSSAPVQSLLKQNSNLRNVDLKQKVSMLKFSDVMKLRKQSPIDRKKPVRKQLLEAMVNMKIVSPFDRQVGNVSSPQLELQKLYVELDRLGEKERQEREVRMIEVGTVRVWGGVGEAAGNLISVLGYREMRNVLPDLVKS